jgi:hypothetical protein
MSEHFPTVETNRPGGFASCFPVPDTRAALEHYEDLSSIVMANQEVPKWAWIRLGKAEIHLYLKEDHDPARAAAADLMVLDCEALERQVAAHRNGLFTAGLERILDGLVPTRPAR